VTVERRRKCGKKSRQENEIAGADERGRERVRDIVFARSELPEVKLVHVIVLK
jgi:hypothetical protein